MASTKRQENDKDSNRQLLRRPNGHGSEKKRAQEKKLFQPNEGNPSGDYPWLQKVVNYLDFSFLYFFFFPTATTFHTVSALTLGFTFFSWFSVLISCYFLIPSRTTSCLMQLAQIYCNSQTKWRIFYSSNTFVLFIFLFNFFFFFANCQASKLPDDYFASQTCPLEPP